MNPDENNVVGAQTTAIQEDTGTDAEAGQPTENPTQPTSPVEEGTQSALSDIDSAGSEAEPELSPPDVDAGRSASQATGPEDKRNLQMLMDVDLTVTAELGRTRMTIGEVISLSAGSIIELSKIAGETVDLRINDKLLASGEVIVVDGHFAVKITRLLSKEERVKSFS